MPSQEQIAAALIEASGQDAGLATVSVEALSSILAAATVALAIRTQSTPRVVLDAMWQTHLGDEKWRPIIERYTETRDG